MAYKVENIVASQKELEHSSMHGTCYESEIVTAFNLEFATQTRCVTSFFSTTTIVEANLRLAGFDSVHGEHSHYHLLFELSFLRI